MSGKFLARASALSLAVFLAACGGDENSTPLVNVNPDSTPTTPPGAQTPDNPETPDDPEGQDPDTETPNTPEAPTLALNFSADKSAIDYTDPDNPNTPSNQTTFTLEVIDQETGETYKSIESPASIVLSSRCIDGSAATVAYNETAPSGIFSGTYTAESCVGEDVITAFLNGNDDVTADISLTIGDLPSTVVPVMGHVDATGTFQEGAIFADETNLTIGGETDASSQIYLKIVDPANENRQIIGQENTVTFFSACMSAGWASVDNESITTEAGEVRARYTPGEECVGEDTLFARLNDDGERLAEVTFTNTPIVAPQEPVVEVIMRANESALTIDPNGEASTDLVVEILKNGETASGDTYTAQFTSMCIDAGRASVTGTNTTTSGAILATYNAAPNCLGTDNVVVFLNGDSTLKASADIIVSDTKLAIGSYDGAGLFTDSLAASKSELKYNTEAEPSTDIRSVIAKVDDAGTFIEQLTGFQSSIEFFSTCLDSGLATIDSTGTTESGELISTYRAQGCVGEDTIYARIGGTDTFASTTVNIAAKEGQELLALGYFDDAGTFNAGVIGNTRDTALPLGVQTKLYLSIADAVTKAQVKGQPLTVEFTSQCGEQPGATTSPLSVNNASVSLGYIEVLYTAQSCGSQNKNEDLVRAELTGVEGFTATAETKIELADLPANSLNALLPERTSLAPSWYSQADRQNWTTLRVQLTTATINNTDGVGIPDERISFALDNPAGVDVATLTPVNDGRTDPDGFAAVEIKALEGFDNVVFRVIASYTDADGNLLQTYSAPIAVNSKLPFEERFSISTSNFAPDTQGKNGVQVQLTLLAADDQGNRIRGNTVVNFETDQGTIDPECVLDNEGRCTITWESLGIDSQNDAEKFATVRAYTQGRLSDGSTGEIDTQVRMLMSTSANIQVDIVVESEDETTPVDTIPVDGGAFCAEAWVEILNDGVRNSPPVGTTLTFEVSNGTLLPSTSNTFELGSSSALLATPYSFTGCTFVEPDPERTEPMRLTVTATPPEGQSEFDRADEL